MMSVDGKPVGVGAGVEFGGINLGQLTQAVTKGLQIAAGHLQHQSSSAFSKGGSFASYKTEYSKPMRLATK